MWCVFVCVKKLVGEEGRGKRGEGGGVRVPGSSSAHSLHVWQNGKVRALTGGYIFRQTPSYANGF